MNLYIVQIKIGGEVMVGAGDSVASGGGPKTWRRAGVGHGDTN